MRKSILPIALGLAALAPAPALARDRDHDGMSDRWEHRHHLRVGVNDAKGDPDHDGLRNRAEFRSQNDPRKRDTDGDGIPDGKEHAGTVTSFQNGVLTIALATGGTLTGQVTDATELKCEGGTARAAGHGSDDNSGPGSGGSDSSDDGPSHDANDDQGEDVPNHDANDDQGDDNGDQPGRGACSTSALVPGAAVHEAELKASGGGAVYKEVELAS